MHSAEFRAPSPFNGFMLVAVHVNDADPELIVTLHRTIDAQLAILRTGALLASLLEQLADLPAYEDGRLMSPDRMYEVTPEGRATLELADAILGGAQ